MSLFITLSQLFSLLDNDMLREIIDGEYKYKPSNWITGISGILNLIIFISSNVMTYYLLTHEERDIKEVRLEDT